MTAFVHEIFKRICFRNINSVLATGLPRISLGTVSIGIWGLAVWGLGEVLTTQQTWHYRGLQTFIK